MDRDKGGKGLKVLVTGARGQLGTDAASILSLEYEVVALGRKDLDIADLDSVMSRVREIKPDIVVNAAAYTHVDGCEENVDLAYRVNAVGPRNLAIACLESNARLVHVSADYVFDGEKGRPYTEFDRTNPLNVYGKSKLAGEELVKEILPRHYIVRTSWLFGEKGNNFVKTMVRLSRKRDSLKVVDDQRGTPTYTRDLVKVIERLIRTDSYGTFHCSNNGECTWYQFAREIFRLMGIEVRVYPVTTEKLARPAARPKFSVLDNYMLRLTIGDSMRSWKEALKEYLRTTHMKVGIV